MEWECLMNHFVYFYIIHLYVFTHWRDPTTNCTFVDGQNVRFQTLAVVLIVCDHWSTRHSYVSPFVLIFIVFFFGVWSRAQSTSQAPNKRFNRLFNYNTVTILNTIIMSSWFAHNNKNVQMKMKTIKHLFRTSRHVHFHELKSFKIKYHSKWFNAFVFTRYTIVYYGYRVL